MCRSDCALYTWALDWPLELKASLFGLVQQWNIYPEEEFSSNSVEFVSAWRIPPSEPDPAVNSWLLPCPFYCHTAGFVSRSLRWCTLTVCSLLLTRPYGVTCIQKIKSQSQTHRTSSGNSSKLSRCLLRIGPGRKITQSAFFSLFFVYSFYVLTLWTWRNMSVKPQVVQVTVDF